MGEVIVYVGYPSSGKSTHRKKYEGYTILNNDENEGTLEDLIPLAEDYYQKGERNFVFDNTYATKKSRKPVIDWAKSHKLPITCIWMRTSIEDAQYNEVERQIKKYGKLLSPEEIKEKGKTDPNVLPPAAQFAWRKKFEDGSKKNPKQKPNVEEGFDSIEEFEFIRTPYPEEYKNKALFLDYDGTLRTTKSGDKYPQDENDVAILPNRAEKIKEYEKKGYTIIGISNQSWIHSGQRTHEQVKKSIEKTNELLGIDIEYYYCPHSPRFQCYCRKPMAGLAIQMYHKYKLDPNQCIMVGDDYRKTDSNFAKRSGMKFIHADKFFGDGD